MNNKRIKPLEILVVDDNPKNLEACKTAFQELKGKELLAVNLSTKYLSHLSWVLPLGETLSEEDFFGAAKEEEIKHVNELLAAKKFPFSDKCNVKTEYGTRKIQIDISTANNLGNVTYVPRAGDALGLMGKADIVLSDLLFKGNDEKTHPKYLDYLREIIPSGAAFKNVLKNYYKNDIQRTDESLNKTLNALRTGTVDPAEIKRRIENIKNSQFGLDIDKFDMYTHLLSDIETGKAEPEFAYGGPLMLEANRLRKPSVLVTSLHRHASDGSSVATSIDGVIALLPLIESRVITYKGAVDDVDERYAGALFGGGNKDSSKGWRVALAKGILQYIRANKEGKGYQNLSEEKL